MSGFYSRFNDSSNDLAYGSISWRVLPPARGHHVDVFRLHGIGARDSRWCPVRVEFSVCRVVLVRSMKKKQRTIFSRPGVVSQFKRRHLCYPRAVKTSDDSILYLLGRFSVGSDEDLYIVLSAANWNSGTAGFMKKSHAFYVLTKRGLAWL